MKKTKLIFLLLLISNIGLSQVWNQRLTGIAMWSLAKDYQGNIYAGASGTTKSIYKSTNGGDNWTEVFSGGVSNFLGIACDSLNNVYAAYVSGGMVKSTNGGTNWTVIPVSTFGSNSVQTVGCGKNGNIFVGTTVGGFYKSTDYGNTFPENPLTGVNVVHVFVDKYNSNIVYAGVSSTGTVGIYRSTDAGSSFGPNINSGISCWGIVQKNVNDLYSVTTTTSYAFSKSSNSGLNWVSVGNLTGAMRGMSLDIAGNMYGSGNGGVWRTTNNGVSFTNFNFTITANQCLAYQNRVLTATTGSTNGGIWFTIDTTITAVNNTGSTLSGSARLEQNDPNPFNAQTEISYYIPGNGTVKLEVFDLRGRLIKSIYNGNQNNGTYRYIFDAGGLSSGIYFYRLIFTDAAASSGDFIQTKKMFFIK
ncbi:MAG: T9SS type A sorting domain-containing protein [Ignavibacteriae bacterium]|nr:T9SS type A sorting domain-containing protein [Ignavibacteriota bacterium]